MTKHNSMITEYRKIMKAINVKLDSLNIIQKEALRKKLIEFTDRFAIYVTSTESIFRPSPSLKHIRTKATYDKKHKTWNVEVMI